LRITVFAALPPGPGPVPAAGSHGTIGLNKHQREQSAAKRTARQRELREDPTIKRELREAALRDQPFGLYLLAVGIGLICYGAFQVVRAKLAKM